MSGDESGAQGALAAGLSDSYIFFLPLVLDGL